MPGPGGGTGMGPQSAGASLRPGEGSGEEVGGGEMLPGHSRLRAAKTHFHLSGETSDQYLIDQFSPQLTDT